jgi:hypothetical protein
MGNSKKVHLEFGGCLQEFSERDGRVDADGVATEMDFLDGGWVDVLQPGLDVGARVEFEPFPVERKNSRRGGHDGRGGRSGTKGCKFNQDSHDHVNATSRW